MGHRYLTCDDADGQIVRLATQDSGPVDAQFCDGAVKLSYFRNDFQLTGTTSSALSYSAPWVPTDRFTGLVWVTFSWVLQTTDTETQVELSVGGSGIQTFSGAVGPVNGKALGYSQTVFNKSLYSPMLTTVPVLVVMRPYVNNLTIASGKLRITLLET